MNVKINNKVIVITGASKGIGSNLAIAMAKEGACVIINYFHSENKAKHLYRLINNFNNNCMIYKSDVSNLKDVRKMNAAILNKYGKIDVLINNAGICSDNTINSMTLSQWNNVIKTNLTGTFICCKELSKSMQKNKCGKIFNIASLKGQVASSNQANYSASKSGIITLTQTLAKEFAEYNVMSNAICPGFISTDLNKDNINKIKLASESSLLNIDYSLNDLISFLIFACSDHFKGISGQVFNLDSRLV